MLYLKNASLVGWHKIITVESRKLKTALTTSRLTECSLAIEKGRQRKIRAVITPLVNMKAGATHAHQISSCLEKQIREERKRLVFWCPCSCRLYEPSGYFIII